KTTGVEAKKRPDGRYDVALSVEARKLYADSKGKETETPLDEMVDVGLFARSPGDKAFGPRDVIAFERREVRSGRQTFHIVANRAPEYGGVDPYNKLIDRNSDDNLTRAD
ncbi:MAG TPA: hypothetical protein VF122_03475, partial [Caulobacteraceae bacterium]